MSVGSARTMTAAGALSDYAPRERIDEARDTGTGVREQGNSARGNMLAARAVAFACERPGAR